MAKRIVGSLPSRILSNNSLMVRSDTGEIQFGTQVKKFRINSSASATYRVVFCDCMRLLTQQFFVCLLVYFFVVLYFLVGFNLHLQCVFATNSCKYHHSQFKWQKVYLSIQTSTSSTQEIKFESCKTMPTIIY